MPGVSDAHGRENASRNSASPSHEAAAKRGELIQVELEERRWLKSTRANGRIHRETTGFSRKDPTWMWKTGCGWKFGLSTEYEWMEADEVSEIQKKILDGILVQSRMCTKGCDLEI